MVGTVISKKYSTYSVLSDGVIYNASIRGTLKFRGHVYVGDEVFFTETNYIIEGVTPRHSLLKRPEISNIDQIVLVFSLVEPDFSYFLAFKYLTYANYNEVPAVIVLSKSDKDDKQVSEIKGVFNKLNIPVYVTSSKTKEGIEEVKQLFKGKKSVLVGQSGVGKSSLLNAINFDYDREVGEYSEALGRGKHKTKEVVLLPFEDGFIADTPGFSSLDLNLTKLEIAHYFPGFEKRYLECFYSNCLHQKEKDCKILLAVQEGNIPSIAYENYLKLLLEGDKY
ncbi:MAG: ribosome small subunit-dependent GTPase A [Bacilli bacterium]|nr:ribosome small subunit-dependent GTPase A [Bacilli bacterium]